jgi:hypothetical protein
MPPTDEPPLRDDSLLSNEEIYARQKAREFPEENIDFSGFNTAKPFDKTVAYFESDDEWIRFLAQNPDFARYVAARDQYPFFQEVLNGEIDYSSVPTKIDNRGIRATNFRTDVDRQRWRKNNAALVSRMEADINGRVSLRPDSERGIALASLQKVNPRVANKALEIIANPPTRELVDGTPYSVEAEKPLSYPALTPEQLEVFAQAKVMDALWKILEDIGEDDE